MVRLLRTFNRKAHHNFKALIPAVSVDICLLVLIKACKKETVDGCIPSLFPF